MAQPMTGRDSAPIARDNRPVSIFAKEERTRMTSRKPAADTTTEPTKVQPEVETPVAETPATPVADLDTLKAQRKALDASIKAAKAALPKLSPLEKAIEQQTAHPADVILRTKVAIRIKAGQPRADAIAAVLELTRAWLEQDIPSE
jgi:hypothetical protein